MFPWSTEIGKTQRGPDALNKSKSTGIHHDHWPPVASLVDGIMIEREWCHRRCVNWSEKSARHDANQQRSKLRKALKKPLMTRVSIRINGKVVSTSDGNVKHAIKKSENLTAKDGPSSFYSEASLDEILRIGRNHSDCIATESISNHMQCSLNAVALFQNALQDMTMHRRSEAISAVRRLRQPLCFSIQSDSQFLQKGDSGSGFTVGFQPPHLDCFGTLDGLLRVGCTQAGSFSAFAEGTSKSLSLVTFQECAIKYNRCFVCWGSCDRGSSVQCSECSVSVHRICVRLEDNSKHKWICSACDVGERTKPSTAQGKCSRCPLPSGLLRTVGSTSMHHLCATWGDDDDNTNGTSPACCLCSSSMGSVVECVAEGCQIRFHPSCASVASALADIDNPSGNNDDVHLCSQYTLSVVEASTIVNNERARLPVAFCGYHNPKRSEMFLGLYPEGCYLDSYHETTPALRIPPQRSVRIVSNGEKNDSKQ